MTESFSHPAGRSLERPVSFPDVLLYRGRAGDGADCLATFDRRNVLLSRPVAGLACKLRLSIGQYQAVAAIARGDRHVVQLMHRDPGLSVDLAEAENFEVAEQYRDRLAEFLGLPVLTLAGRSPNGETVVGGRAPSPRRKVKARVRRPRFLTRRKPGAVVALRRIEGREIIARS